MILVLIGLFILLFNFTQGKNIVVLEELPFIDRVVMRVFGPVQNKVSHFFSGINHIWGKYLVLTDQTDEIARLQAELDLERTYVVTLKERQRVQTQEEVTGHNYEKLGLKGVFARVTGYDPLASSQAVWLSAGMSDGISVDNPVMTEKGLVGRIIKVFDHTSQVLLLVDSHFAVDVVDQETRVRALVSGMGNGIRLQKYPLLSHLEFLKLGEAIHVGDLLLTSGLNGIYPPGIPVGNVIKATREEDASFTTAVLPVIDTSDLEQVFVVTTQIP